MHFTMKALKLEWNDLLFIISFFFRRKHGKKILLHRVFVERHTQIFTYDNGKNGK